MTDFKVGDKVRFKQNKKVTHDYLCTHSQRVPVPEFDKEYTIVAVFPCEGEGEQTQFVDLKDFVEEVGGAYGGEWFEKSQEQL